MLNDYLRSGSDLTAFGIDETKFEKVFPDLMHQFFKKEEEAGLKERLLASEDATFIYKKKTTNYRFIPKGFFNPTPSMTYGNKIGFVIWEPLIVIENADLADSFRKHFNMLWKVASKTRKSKNVGLKK